MTEATPAPETKRPRAKNEEVIEDAVVVDDTAPVEVDGPAAAEVAPIEPEEVEGETELPAEPVTPVQQVVYVQVPAAPRKLGNRGVGAALAVAAGVVYAAILAGLTIIIGLVGTGTVSLGFLARAEFYIPTLFFIIAFVVLVLIANRANWWAYIVGSIIVGVVVYFGTIGLGLLTTGIILDTPAEAAERFAAATRSPFIVGAALLAREVSMWTGTAISRRGRMLKVRNAEARAAYERELAEKRAEHARGAAAGAPAA